MTQRVELVTSLVNPQWNHILNTFQRWLLIAAVLLAGAGLTFWLNSGYRKISSESYDYALALVSACNRHDEARVQQIATKLAADELPKYDQQVLNNIAQIAIRGDWELASSRARDLLNAQIQKVP